MDWGNSSYGRARALHLRGTGVNPWNLQFFFLFQNCISGVKRLFRSHLNWIGGLAHMVERVLCMHEVQESMPGSSGFFFLYKFAIIEVKNFPPLIGTVWGIISF